MTQTVPRRSTGGYITARPYRTLAGLSAGAPTTQQIAGLALSSGTGIATAAAAGLSLTIPIIGAAIGALTLGINALLNSGCGQTCIVTSNWANQAEGLLKNNIREYISIPAPRPQSAQTAALANFDKVWNYLYQQCSAAQLGAAGQNCIGDRQSGSCKWRADGTDSFPGAPAVGQCWNWFNGYRDPIANDPNVVSDAQYEGATTSGGTSVIPSSVSSLLSSNSFLLLAAGVILISSMGGRS